MTPFICSADASRIIECRYRILRPDSLPRLWRYINLLLTYLLTAEQQNRVKQEATLSLG